MTTNQKLCRGRKIRQLNQNWGCNDQLFASNIKFNLENGPVNYFNEISNQTVPDN